MPATKKAKLIQEKYDALYAQGKYECKTCEEVRPLAEFQRDSSRRHGVKPKCKACHAEAMKRSRESDPEHHREIVRKSQAKHREKRRAGSREYYAKNRDKCLASSRAYYQKNAERYKEQAAAYRKAHPESVKRWAADRKLREPLYTRLMNGEKRAQRHGRAWERLCTQDILDYWESVGISPDHDVYTGEPLKEDWEIDHVIPLSADNSPGHIRQNLAPTNKETNAAKKAAHLVEFLAARAEAGIYEVDEETRKRLLEK